MLDQIELLGVDDLPDCVALAKDRGWAPRERMWRLLLVEGSCYGVRDDDGQLVGTVVLTWYGHDVATIGMMLVATRYGRRGIGRLLMENALAEAGGATVLLHATEQGRPLYEKLGFWPVGTSHTHQGVFAPTNGSVANGAATGSATIGVRTANLDDRDRIVELDTEVFGADRGALLSRLPDFAERLLVTDADGALPTAGFASSWNGADLTVVGPVIAETAETAKLLIAELASAAAGEVRVDLDERHPQLRSWAGEHGLAPTSSTTIMVRGARSLPGDRSRCFAPLSPALG